MTTPDHDRGLLPALGALILIVTALTASAPSPAFAGGAADWPALKPGEATVWYLGHCGYAVKTRSKLLVFDYTGDFKPQVQPPAERALANGWINPEEIKDLDVIVFASHDHADHYDSVIRGWEKAVKTIHYVFGWDAGAAPHVHSLAGPRGTAAFDGVEIFTVNDHHDTVPEVAFLVRVDGVTIYFNGDYYGKMGRDLPSTTVNDMRYLRSKSQTVDLAFILASASDTYNTIIRSLAPKTVFPMHAPANGESMYATYASDLRKAGIDTPVVVPDKPGKRFDVRNGMVVEGGSAQGSIRSPSAWPAPSVAIATGRSPSSSTARSPRQSPPTREGTDAVRSRTACRTSPGTSGAAGGGTVGRTRRSHRVVRRLERWWQTGRYGTVAPRLN